MHTSHGIYDFKVAFDSVDRSALQFILKQIVIPDALLNLECDCHLSTGASGALVHGFHSVSTQPQVCGRDAFSLQHYSVKLSTGY